MWAQRHSAITGLAIRTPASSDGSTTFDPSEIESIQIIKGPAAATVYGTEAANGVIQIITKKGTGTAPRANLQVQNGAIYFRDAQGRMPTNFYQDSTGKILSFNGVSAARALGTPLFKTGQQRQYNGDVAGGFANATYYVAGSYSNNLGVEPNNNTRQFSGHANLDIAPSNAIDVATSLNYVSGAYHLGADVGLSSMLDAEFGNPVLFSVPGAGGFYPNVPPAVPQSLFDNSDNITRFTGSVTLTNRPLSWFNHRLIIGLDNNGDEWPDARAVCPAGSRSVYARRSHWPHWTNADRDERGVGGLQRDGPSFIEPRVRPRRRPSVGSTIEPKSIRASWAASASPRQASRPYLRLRPRFPRHRPTRSTRRSAGTRRKSLATRIASFSLAQCVSTTTAPSAHSSRRSCTRKSAPRGSSTRNRGGTCRS